MRARPSRWPPARTTRPRRPVLDHHRDRLVLRRGVRHAQGVMEILVLPAGHVPVHRHVGGRIGQAQHVRNSGHATSRDLVGGLGNGQAGAPSEAVGHSDFVGGPGTVFPEGALAVPKHGMGVLRVPQPVQPVRDPVRRVEPVRDPDRACRTGDGR